MSDDETPGDRRGESVTEIVKREVRLAVIEKELIDQKAATLITEKTRAADYKALEDKVEWLTRFLLGTAVTVIVNLLATLGNVALYLYNHHPSP